MTTLFAQPYDMSATGFYFTSADEYAGKAARAVNDYGDPVEEFEIQFIDGEDMDCALAGAWGLNQSNVADFLQAAGNWDDREKIAFIVAVGECGYRFDPRTDDPNELDVDLYEVDSLRNWPSSLPMTDCSGSFPTICAAISTLTPSPAIWPLTMP